MEEGGCATISVDGKILQSLACGTLFPTVPAAVETITLVLPIPTTVGNEEALSVMFLG